MSRLHARRITAASATVAPPPLTPRKPEDPRAEPIDRLERRIGLLFGNEAPRDGDADTRLSFVE